MIEHSVLNHGGVAPGNGRWRELAELLDPAAFEERLRDARARRAIALATKAATKAATKPRPGRATPPILPTHPGARDIEAPAFVPPFARMTTEATTVEPGWPAAPGSVAARIESDQRADDQRADDQAVADQTMAQAGETRAKAMEGDPVWAPPPRPGTGDSDPDRQEPGRGDAFNHDTPDPHATSGTEARPRKRVPRIEIAPGPERRRFAGLAALPPFLSRIGASGAALASQVTIPPALAGRITELARLGRRNPRMAAGGAVLASLLLAIGGYLLMPTAPETAGPAPTTVAEAPAVTPDAPREIAPETASATATPVASEGPAPEATADTAAVETVPAAPLPETMPEPVAMPGAAEDPRAETELTAAQAMPEPDPGLMPSPEPAVPEAEVAAIPAPAPTPAPAPDPAADAMAFRPLARPGTVPPITAAAPVLTTWENTRVVVNVPGGGTTGDVVATEAAIAAAGFPNVERARVDVAQERPNVRYFHAGDAEAAQALAAATGSIARNFTWHTPVPREGYLELWLSGSAPREARAPAPAENMILGILRDRAAQN